MMSDDVMIEIRSTEDAVEDLERALTEDGVAPEVRRLKPSEALPGPGVFEVVKFSVEVLVVLIHSKEVAAVVARRLKEFTAKHGTTAEVRNFATGQPVVRVEPSTSVEAITNSIRT